MEVTACKEEQQAQEEREERWENEDKDKRYKQINIVNTSYVRSAPQVDIGRVASKSGKRKTRDEGRGGQWQVTPLVLVILPHQPPPLERH